MKPVGRRNYLGTLGAASAFSIVPPPGARRPRLHRTKRHDPARAGGLRDAGPAAGERGSCAGRPAVRGRGGSESRFAGLRRLGGVRQPWSASGSSSTTQQWGASDTGIHAGRDVARTESWKPTTRTESPGREHPRLRGLPRDAQEGNQHGEASGWTFTPNHQHGSINISALRKGEAASRRAGRERAAPGAPGVVQAARESEERRRTCWPTATTQIATGSRHGSTRASSARCARSTTGQTGRSGRRACRSTAPLPGPPVPPGFNWALWQGPEPEHPSHPSYTFAVYRGWCTLSARDVLATWATTACGSRTASSILVCRRSSRRGRTTTRSSTRTT